ncbi:hypothetical protein M7I_1498 [Glarea lozoyensis 74030]|uniref:Uncharacterized protein n=1 Tax=Glarea lozoyensis (strain ATCC 74030 / MF5533) TaxID=1104152 RepID=H0EG88_GLAL7|nr:hypothetical protein M7I_1498 [Glarea lozoyensis 74030]
MLMRLPLPTYVQYVVSESEILIAAFFRDRMVGKKEPSIIIGGFGTTRNTIGNRTTRWQIGSTGVFWYKSTTTPSG